MKNNILALLALFLLIPTPLFGKLAKRFSMGLWSGYSNLTAKTQSNSAQYNGFSLGINSEINIYHTKAISFDFDLGYQMSFLENLSSTQNSSEWLHTSNYYAGLNFYYSLFVLGGKYHMTTHKHLNNSTSMTQYDFSPISIHAGFSYFFDKRTQINFIYSQNLENQISVNSENLKINGQTFWLSIQINFKNGIGRSLSKGLGH